MDDLAFGIDGDARSWRAVSFGPPWNGWDTPRVTRATLAQLLPDLHEGHRWTDDGVLVWPTADLMPDEPHDPETEDLIRPDADGAFDLGYLGWVFVRRSGGAD
jgi:hypothetical protein